jgi:hypothetical protein
VFYAGAEEKRAFASLLKDQADGVSAETIEFALFDPFQVGYTYGANTNAVLLDSCGKLVVHADDDSVFLSAAPPLALPGLRLTSAVDPTEWRFFADSRERERQAVPRDSDLLAAHQELLGQPVAACLRRHSGEADCDEVAPEFLTVLESAGTKVAVTMAGVCGDSGLGSPLAVLWVSGATRETVLASEQSYRAAQRGREILRAAPCVTLSQSAFLMSNHCGLDNRLALPPFLPALRNSDGVFGQVLKACQPRSLIAHLPEAVLHLPGEQRAFAGEPRVLPRLSDLRWRRRRGRPIRSGACSPSAAGWSTPGACGPRSSQVCSASCGRRKQAT